MKKDEFKKLKQRPVEDLKREIHDSRDKLRVLRFDLASGKTKNSSLVRDMRKRIAKVETLVQEKSNSPLEASTETK